MLKANNYPQLKTTQGARVAIIDGLRTPFVKKNTDFKDVYAKDLGAMVTNELLNRLPIERTKIDQLIFGQVMHDPDVPNISREIALLLNMPHLPAYTVSNACITGIQVLANMASSIAIGAIDCGIAGAADSFSNAPIRLNSRLIQQLKDILKAKTYTDKYHLLRQIKLQDIKFNATNLRDPLTGLSLSDVSEQLAYDFHLSREELDQYAARSHLLAKQAWQSGVLREQVMVSFPPPYTQFVISDNHFTKNIKPQFYQKFKPFNSAYYATATEWNTSCSCDGAAAILLMNEQQAKAEGLTPLGYIRSYATVATDVWQNMLCGAVPAIAMVLDQTGISLQDLDLIDLHETSAAQVLTNLRLLDDQQFTQQTLNRTEKVGEVDMDKFNVWGGSLAYGNPRAVSSLRLAIQSLYELKRRGGHLSLIASSSLGGLGGAMILERE
ncbi:acetyl-CoA acetyltransferase [Mergibacter septicus]|uniref:acetyl-CoA C-acyltransferase n=1 Tax=Mergibacter septicus TaxID=221402 RepID=UPI001C77CB1D|nr:acetyl-CoA C-acyltransferase [Mergibacter septicus]QDJ12505.1 acetyl-CoA acetyltransferase [Mergibacter septicus]